MTAWSWPSFGLQSRSRCLAFDQAIGLLKRTVHRAKLGSGEALAAIKRLDSRARALEASVAGPAFESFVAAEPET